MRVVVTGAAGGIGSGVVETLAAAGHTVVAVDHDADGLAALPEEVETRTVDLREADAVQNALSGIDVDAVVSCVGGYEIAALEDTTPNSFRRQLETNLTAVHTVVHATAPTLRARGGRVVVVGSMVGSVPLPYHGAYSAAKAGLDGYVGALRRELESRGATVTLVEPGPVRTGFNERAIEGLDSQSGSAYADIYRQFDAYTPAATDVDTVVETVVTATTAEDPRTRYRVSPRARWLPWLAAVLPDRLYDRFVRAGLPGGVLGRLIDR